MSQSSIFERLREHYENQLAFVAYHKPQDSSGTVFFQKDDRLITTTSFSESGFVFAPFDSRREAIVFPEEVSEKVIFEIPVFEEEHEPEPKEIDSNPSGEEKQQHFSLVEKALFSLNSGEMQKVVLSRKEKVALANPDPIALFLRLLKNYASAFVYLWYHPKVGLWLGATPEILLKISGRKFRTMALAGTKKFTGKMEVSWGEKEKQEQQFVTDSILQNLKESGIENLESSSPTTSKAGNLLHLRTDIQGTLESTDIQSGISEETGYLIKALHPTPAVCGLPKNKAEEFIFSEENYDREFYTGFLGELNLQKNVQRSRNRRNTENLAYRAIKKETSLFVNLRCMKIEKNIINIFVGGGITKDSDPEAEWEETINKSQTMKKVVLKKA